MTARPYILSENTWKTVKDTKYELAVLPWGATEAHNYHLPYSTDVTQCDHIAAEAARLAWEKGAKVVILPTIPFGVNTGQLDVKLDMNLNPSTQFAILKDLADVLSRQRINKLLILNGHGGNDFKQMVRELGAIYPDIFITTCHWFKAVDGQDYFTDTGDHAGEMETSLMMHLVPDLVLPLEEAGDGHAKQFKIEALREGWAWAERQWTKVTKDTGIGNPKDATAAKGKKYFEAVTKKVSKLFLELCKTDMNNLYE